MPPQVEALLTGGDGQGTNWGVQITEHVYTALLGWILEDGGWPARLKKKTPQAPPRPINRAGRKANVTAPSLPKPSPER